jgi:hypothetical protein
MGGQVAGTLQGDYHAYHALQDGERLPQEALHAENHLLVRELPLTTAAYAERCCRAS